MVSFIILAVMGAPQRIEERLRDLQNTVRFKDEAKGEAWFSYCHLALKLLQKVQLMVNLIFHVFATVLVVPVVKTVAMFCDCVHEDPSETGSCLLGGACHVATAPTVLCY